MVKNIFFVSYRVSYHRNMKIIVFLFIFRITFEILGLGTVFDDKFEYRILFFYEKKTKKGPNFH